MEDRPTRKPQWRVARKGIAWRIATQKDSMQDRPQGDPLQWRIALKGTPKERSQLKVTPMEDLPSRGSNERSTLKGIPVEDCPLKGTHNGGQPPSTGVGRRDGVRRCVEFFDVWLMFEVVDRRQRLPLDEEERLRCTNGKRSPTDGRRKKGTCDDGLIRRLQSRRWKTENVSLSATDVICALRRYTVK